eukprot:2937410-Lingulodinium_polyedra.AAC.1
MDGFAAAMDAVHRDLGDVCARMDAAHSIIPRAQGVPLIRQASGGEDDARVCIPLEQLRNTDVDKVGGRSASLGEMISQLSD